MGKQTYDEYYAPEILAESEELESEEFEGLNVEELEKLEREAREKQKIAYKKMRIAINEKSQTEGQTEEKMDEILNDLYDLNDLTSNKLKERRKENIHERLILLMDSSKNIIEASKEFVEASETRLKIMKKIDECELE